MGLIQRLKRITAGRIEAFLQSVEDPALVLPQLVGELEEKVGVAAAAEAKALTAVRGAQRKIDEYEGRVARLERGAEIALKACDEKTTRDALAAQLEAEKTLARHREEWRRAENAFQDAQAVRRRLEQEWQDLRARQSEIVVRARSAHTQRDIQRRTLEPGRTILDQVAAMEARLDEIEAHLALQREADGTAVAPLELRLKSLEQKTEVERRLAALRAQRADNL